jgi:tight adherence protein B
MNPLIGISIGLVVVWGLAIGGYLIISRRQSVVEDRLGEIVKAGQIAPPVKPKTQEKRPGVLSEMLSQAVAQRGFAENIKRDLARADLKLNVGEYMMLHVVTVFGGGAFGWVLGGGLQAPLGVVTMVFTIGGMILGIFVPRIYVGMQQGNRLKAFDGQLGDMLNLVVNGLRAGYSVMQALEAVSKELPPPISVEFKRLVQEMQLGIPMEAALANLTRRIPSKDLDFVVTAINVQREVGGNLAEILDSISYTIRERVRIKGEIATLTAQGMMTGYVISGLPIALALFLYLVNRAYMEQFWTSPPIVFGLPICGIIMLVTAALMIVIGFAIVLKIVDIEV